MKNSVDKKTSQDTLNTLVNLSTGGAWGYSEAYENGKSGARNHSSSIGGSKMADFLNSELVPAVSLD